MDRRSFLGSIFLSPFALREIVSTGIEKENTCQEFIDVPHRSDDKLMYRYYCNMPMHQHSKEWSRIQHMCITKDRGVTGWTVLDGKKHVTFISGSKTFEMAFGRYQRGYEDK